MEIKKLPASSAKWLGEVADRGWVGEEMESAAAASELTASTPKNASGIVKAVSG